jgi:hypothetical protein
MTHHRCPVCGLYVPVRADGRFAEHASYPILIGAPATTCEGSGRTYVPTKEGS